MKKITVLLFFLLLIGCSQKQEVQQEENVIVIPFELPNLGITFFYEGEDPHEETVYGTWGTDCTSEGEPILIWKLKYEDGDKYYTVLTMFDKLSTPLSQKNETDLIFVIVEGELLTQTEADVVGYILKNGYVVPKDTGGLGGFPSTDWADMYEKIEYWYTIWDKIHYSDYCPILNESTF